MNLFLFVVLMTPSLPPKATRCAGLEIETARAARVVYLDPAPATRKTTTHEVIERVLHQLEDPAVLGDREMDCATEVISAIEKFGDQELLQSEFRLMREEYAKREQELSGDSSEESRRVVRAGMSLAEEHERALRMGRVDTVPVPTPDALLATDCPSARRAASAIVDRLSKLHSRLEVLDAIFALPVIDTDPCSVGAVPNPDFKTLFRPMSSSALARAWALDVITEDRDPRRWDPQEVARLVVAARARERDIPVESFLSRLKPIGLRRASDLLFPPPSIPRYPELPPSPAVVGYTSSEGAWHFSFEAGLYASEWATFQRPSSKDGNKVREKERYSLERYKDERWIETDNMAPHPDLESVRRAVDDLLRAKRHD